MQNVLLNSRVLGVQVATVHDILIHPDLQGFGIGGRLVRSLINQISQLGIFDVGLIAPSELQSFFRSCSFDLDHEESVPMALMDTSIQNIEDINAYITSNQALKKILDTALSDDRDTYFTS